MSPGFSGDPSDARSTTFFHPNLTPAMVERGFKAVGRRKYVLRGSDNSAVVVHPHMYLPGLPAWR
ncbi:MAG TPA: hypothetical protein VGG05_19095 [Pseudonocardiaceae bacterium]